MTASLEERAAALRKLIEEAAAQQQVPEEDVALVDDDELGVLVKQKLITRGALQRTTYDKLVAAGVSRGAAEVLKMMFPGPTKDAALEAAGPGTGARVAIQVQIFDEELDEIDEVKMTLQVSEAGQKQLEGAMKRWDCRGLWDGVTRTPSGYPAIINQVEELKSGVTYVARGFSSKGVKRIERQLQNAGKKHELELEKAIVREVSALGCPPVEARPDLHLLQSKTVNLELDAVALGDKIAVIAEHEESAAVTKDNTFAIVEEVCEKAQVVSFAASNPEFAGTKFAAFKGRQITPAVMYEYVDPKLQPALDEVCTRKRVLQLGRNGKGIGRVPAVKAVAALGAAKRLVQSPVVRL